MKKIYIALTVVLASFVLIGVFVYAWQATRQSSIPLNGSSSGVTISYKIGDNETNINTLSINNITFFDEDNQNEVDYSSMMFKSDLIIKNTCDNNIDVNVSQILEELPTDFTNLTSIETAYIRCLFSYNEIDFSSISKLSDLYTSNESLDFSLNISESKTVKLYIFGVQLNDSATNEFLDSTYSFKIKISSIGK